MRAQIREGLYEVEGTNPDGSTYEGRFLLQAGPAASWVARWQVGDEQVIGLGLIQGGVLAVSFVIDGRPGIAVLVGQSSEAGTPTPRIIGASGRLSPAGFEAPAWSAPGALAAWECPAAAAGTFSCCWTEVSLAAPCARLALRLRRALRGRDCSRVWSE